MTYLSFLMGGKDITDKELAALNIETVEKDSDGDRKLKIPSKSITEYLNLIENKLDSGFWNEAIGDREIIFIFKFKDGSTRRYKLSPESEAEIDKLCAEFNNEPAGKTQNVYKYLSENSFYQNFMMEHYVDLIKRK